MPPSNVDVPEAVERSVPPVSVMPPEDERPAVATPPVNVDVPVPPTRIVDDAWKRSRTFKVLATVEDACERNPPAWVSRSCTRNVEAIEEEAEETNPPWSAESPVKFTVDEARS
jgi:hypothetical protein